MVLRSIRKKTYKKSTTKKLYKPNKKTKQNRRKTKHNRRKTKKRGGNDDNLYSTFNDQHITSRINPIKIKELLLDINTINEKSFLKNFDFDKDFQKIKLENGILNGRDKKELQDLIEDFNKTITSDEGKFIDMLTICKNDSSHYFNIDGGKTIKNLSESNKKDKEYITLLKFYIVNILSKDSNNYTMGPNQDCIFIAITLILFPEFVSLSIRTKPLNQPKNEKESINEIKTMINDLNKLSDLQHMVIESLKNSEELNKAIDTLSKNFENTVKESVEKYNINVKKYNINPSELMIDITDNDEFNDEFNDIPYKETNEKLTEQPELPEVTDENIYKDAFNECNNINLKLNKKPIDFCNTVYDYSKGKHKNVYDRKLKCTLLAGKGRNFNSNFKKCLTLYDNIRIKNTNNNTITRKIINKI